MNYKFDDTLIEQVFDDLSVYSKGELAEDEITAKMLFAKNARYTHRQWFNFLQKAEHDGLYTSRIVRNGARAFKRVDGHETADS